MQTMKVPYLFSNFGAIFLKDTKENNYTNKNDLCGVGTSLDIVTWITSTRFGTQFTIEIGKTGWVAIHSFVPTFYYIDNTESSQEFTDLYPENWGNRIIAENIKHKAVFTYTGISNTSIILTAFKGNSIIIKAFKLRTLKKSNLVKKSSIILCLLTLQMTLSIFPSVVN